MNNETVTNIANRNAMARGNNERANYVTQFSAFRKYAKSINTAIRKDYEEMEKQKAENKEELSTKKAGEKNLELDEAFRTMVKMKQDILTNNADRLGNNTKRANKKFAMIPPRQENILEITSAEPRIDNMSETEIQMHIEKYSDNYQESAYFHDIARKHGKDYEIPFEPEEANKNVDKLVSLIKEQVIPFIADDPLDHIEMATYFRGDEATDVYGELNYLTDYFDNLPRYVEDDYPMPELEDRTTIESDLLKIRQTCWNNNSKALWEEAVSVSMDIQKNGLTTENITKANRLTKIVGELFPSESDAKKG